MNVTLVWLLLIVSDVNVPIVTFYGTEQICHTTLKDTIKKGAELGTNIQGSCKQVRLVQFNEEENADKL